MKHSIWSGVKTAWILLMAAELTCIILGKELTPTWAHPVITHPITGILAGITWAVVMTRRKI